MGLMLSGLGFVAGFVRKRRAVTTARRYEKGRPPVDVLDDEGCDFCAGLILDEQPQMPEQ